MRDVRPILPVVPEKPEEIGDRLGAATIQMAAGQPRVVIALFSERQQSQADEGVEKQEHALRVGLAASGHFVSGASGRADYREYVQVVGRQQGLGLAEGVGEPHQLGIGDCHRAPPYRGVMRRSSFGLSIAVAALLECGP